MNSTDETNQTALGADAVAEFTRLLTAERNELLAPPIGADTVATDLTDDPGTRLAEHDALATMNNLQAAQLEQVDAALARLEAGTFGQCADCGRAIPLERLEIVPSAAFCVSCQERHAG